MARHAVRRLHLSEVGGPEGVIALVGPHTAVGSDLARQLRTGRLVVCIDGRDDPRPVVMAAKQLHAWFGAPTWVVCRITRRDTGHRGTLLEAGCAHRAAKLIAPDVGWEVVGPSVSDLVAFTQYVDGTAIVVADTPSGRRRREHRFALAVARGGSAPVVVAERATTAPDPPRRHLTLVG